MSLGSDAPLPAGSRIAVIGGGCAGIVAAHYLSGDHTVTLFEAGPRLGGHVHTACLPHSMAGPDANVPVDMGFIVFNTRTYPHFLRFLDELNVPAMESTMSFSYSEPHTGFCFAGSDANGLFARRRHLASPSFWRFLRSIQRFNKSVLADLETDTFPATLGEYLQRRRQPQEMRQRYLEPMVRAIWSSESQDVDGFPMRRFARFFANHGLLSLRNRPRWLTIPGGGQRYVRAFAQSFDGEIRLNEAVHRVHRLNDAGVSIQTDAGDETFDAAVMACHADQTLTMLSEPSPEEARALSAFRYTENEVCLHCDEGFLPANRRCWASWNVSAEPDDPESRVNVHYWMNRLQRLPASRTWIVSLNPRTCPAAPLVAETARMAHPQYDQAALDAQISLAELNGCDRLWFCGAYHGDGFHEDAAASGVRAASAILGRPAQSDRSPA